MGIGGGNRRPRSSRWAPQLLLAANPSRSAVRYAFRGRGAPSRFMLSPAAGHTSHPNPGTRCGSLCRARARGRWCGGGTGRPASAARAWGGGGGRLRAPRPRPGRQRRVSSGQVRRVGWAGAAAGGADATSLRAGGDAPRMRSRRSGCPARSSGSPCVPGWAGLECSPRNARGGDEGRIGGRCGYQQSHSPP